MGRCLSRARSVVGDFQSGNVAPDPREHAEGKHLLSRRSAAEKLERLRTMDCFVLDNTIRETTVGAIRGHTPQDKHQILKLVESCGFTDYVIAAFGDRRRADDKFVEELVASGRDLSRAWCFSELYDGFEGEHETRRGRRPVLDTPHGLERAVSLRIPSVIIERDVVCRRTSWDRWSEEEEMAMFTRRVQFAQDHGLQRVLFNFRDFCVACAENMPWVIRLTRHVATLAQQFSGMVFGIIWEEPTGCLFPFEIVDWVSEVRAVMDDAGWREGHLLLHIHRGYGMSEAIVIECLAAGCTGIWCATCTNGAATGHACSAITLTNLARIGNTQICEKYCFHAIRRCAIEVCKIVTGAAPEVSTEVYGERALETVFDASSGMGGGSGGDPTELLCDMFGESRRMRISTMATPVMFQTKLMEIFGGTSEDYGIGLCWEMRSKMHEDLVSGRKEEYNTAAGLSALFERVGGTLTEGMVSRIVRENSFKSHPVLVELQAAWRRVLHGTDPAAFPPPLPFRVFYDRFMAKFVPCYSCQLADSLFGALLVTDDGRLRWEAVEMRACWALDEYGDEIANADDLFHVVFQKLLLPLAVERTMLRPGDKDVAAAGEEAKLVLSGDFVPTGSCKVARRKLFSITLRHGYESALLGASGSLNDWGGSTVSVGVGPSLARVGELGETRL